MDIEVHDKDNFSSDLVGKGSYALGALCSFKTNNFSGNIPIYYKDKPSGEAFFEIDFYPDAPAVGGNPGSHQPVPLPARPQYPTGPQPSYPPGSQPQYPPSGYPQYPPAAYPPGGYPPRGYPPQQYPPGSMPQYPPGQYPPGGMPRYPPGRGGMYRR